MYWIIVIISAIRVIIDPVLFQIKGSHHKLQDNQCQMTDWSLTLYKNDKNSIYILLYSMYYYFESDSIFIFLFSFSFHFSSSFSNYVLHFFFLYISI